MGFLDKLLGRSKDAAETVGDKAQDVGDKATDVFEDDKDSVPSGTERSDVGQAEQRLDDVRDQTLRDEGRMP